MRVSDDRFPDVDHFKGVSPPLLNGVGDHSDDKLIFPLNCTANHRGRICKAPGVVTSLCRFDIAKQDGALKYLKGVILAH